MDVASGIDRHPDRTEISFRLQICLSEDEIHCLESQGILEPVNQLPI